jgi:hypothetical protein
MSHPILIRVRLILGAFLLTFLAAPVRADERPARVSDILGTFSVNGAEEDEITSLDQNSVVREGDTLWTDRRSRAEMELEQGSRIRLSESSKLEIRSLNGSPELRLWSGSLYLDLSDRWDQPFLVDTPEGEIRVEPNSVVRVDLGADSDTRVSVWSGEARVTPENGEPARLRSSERVYLESGHIVEGPERFDRDDRDAFDRYHIERVDYYIDRPLPRELEHDLPGARDLQQNGAWVVMDQVRYWRPYHEVDWRPYSRGYWSVAPGWGYTWVDYHPWGYVTSHYGRWLYQPSHGWLWYPGYVWSPAAVYWGTWGDYYGWAPLDPWDRPCFFGMGSFIALGLDIDFQCWTFCHRNRFFYGRHHWRLEDGRKHLHGWKEVRLPRERFRPVQRVYDEIGIPRHNARGLTVNRDGRPARDGVLESEKRIPERRLRTIQQRFHVSPDRDRQRAQRSNEVERYQRAPWLDIVPEQILVRKEAEQRVRRAPSIRTPRAGPAPRGTTTRPGRDEPFRRNQPSLPRPDRIPAQPRRLPATPPSVPTRPGRTPGGAAVPRTPAGGAPRHTQPAPTQTRPVPPAGRPPSGGTAPGGVRTAPPMVRPMPGRPMPGAAPAVPGRPSAPTGRGNRR